ncbi:hypothetical protein OHA61_34550 [Streptomyces sp. NBC_00885]|nr:hypothetical protein OHA61_34550 [Streptomyces sp. NBC_00885]
MGPELIGAARVSLPERFSRPRKRRGRAAEPEDKKREPGQFRARRGT